MRQEREEFRKSIVKWIIREDEDLNDDIFRNSNERQILQYYQYIAHGIDACHVAPISKHIWKRLIKKRIFKYIQSNNNNRIIITIAELLVLYPKNHSCGVKSWNLISIKSNPSILLHQKSLLWILLWEILWIESRMKKKN